MRHSLLAVSLLSLVAVSPLPGEEPASPLRMETLAPGVFAFLPTPEAFDRWRAISNSGAVVLDDGVLIYDSHWTPELAEMALALLRQHTTLPVRYVVSSHYHGDHTGGYWAYGRDVEIVAHRETRARLEAEAATVAEELAKEIAQLESQIAQIEDGVQKERMENVLATNRGLERRLAGGRQEPLPSLTFDSRVTLHRGRTVEIYFLGRGHTAGDAILVLPDDKVGFFGDLLFHDTLPNVNDGFAGDWLSTLAAIRQLGAEHVVPGHGTIGGPEIVDEQIAYLEWLRGAVLPFVRDGKEVDEAIASVTLPERFADYAFGFFLPANIRKVFAELDAKP